MLALATRAARAPGLRCEARRDGLTLFEPLIAAPARRPARRAFCAARTLRARALSTAAEAAEPAKPLIDGESSLVIGACYVGALVWAYNDGVFTKLYGADQHVHETQQAKDQLSAIESDVAEIKRSLEKRAISSALKKHYSK